MDITTLLGIAFGVGMVLIAIFKGGGVAIFINIPSMMITVGGTIGATLINFPLSKVIGVMKIVKKAFLYKEPLSHETITMFVDGTAPETIRDILRIDLDVLESRHRLGQSIFNALGAYAPAFGMIGTLIGLIQMLRSLDDPSKIGQGMATALITTFYGALMANLIFLPIAGKLKVRSEEEILTKELIIEGIMAIQSGDNPRIVEEKLKSFVAPSLREKITTGKRK